MDLSLSYCPKRNKLKYYSILLDLILNNFYSCNCGVKWIELDQNGLKWNRKVKIVLSYHLKPGITVNNFLVSNSVKWCN